ncbi:MAG: DUF6252 family protein [Psychroflexus sp.]|nr:DUF6252 family protein [Psychroflexus sp.]
MRYTIIILLSFLLSGCSDDLGKKNQVLQGLYNDFYFRSETVSAQINENGFLVIQAESDRTVTLQVENAETGVYEITATNNNQATFNDGSSIFITEGEDTGGRIEIEQITNNSVFGNFFFNAKANGQGEVLNFQKGVFLEVPIENGSVDDSDEDVFFQAIVDGADFNANSIGGSVTNGVISIVGAQGDISMTLSFSEELTPGDYTLGEEDSLSITYIQSNNQESASSGNLTIDTINDNEVIGSFTFTTENGIEVTQGGFNISL